MKRAALIGMLLVVCVSCAPVFDRDLIGRGIRDVPLSGVLRSPESYTDRLFILGGVIVETKFTEAGSQIEALSVPVNRLGYLRDAGLSGERYLAVYPKERGLLDPLIYRQGRQVTLAALFRGVRSAKLDEAEYHYPVFEIEQVYLWEEYRDYPYLYPYYPYWWYDPWWRPYPPARYGLPPGW